MLFGLFGIILLFHLLLFINGHTAVQEDVYVKKSMRHLVSSGTRKRKPADSKSKVKRYYWRAEDKIEVLIRDRNPDPVSKRRKKHLHRRPIENGLSRNDKIYSVGDILTKHLKNQFQFLPLFVQLGYEKASHELIVRPYPLTIITLSVYQNSILPIMLPYVSLALDMLIVDEVHIWPIYDRKPNNISSLPNITTSGLEELHQLLHHHRLISETSGRNDTFHKVHVFTAPQSLRSPRQTLGITAFYEFYTGYGVVRQEDILLHCKDEVVFLDIIRLAKFTSAIRQQQQLDSRDQREAVDTENGTSAILSTKPTIFVANIMNDIDLFSVQQSPLWPQRWLKMPSNVDVTMAEAQLRFHKHFTSNWGNLLSLPAEDASMSTKGVVYGKWTRQINRLYISANMPSLPVSELQTYLAETSFGARPTTNQSSAIESGGDNYSFVPYVPKSILKKFYLKINPETSSIHHLVPLQHYKYVIDASKYLFIRPQSGDLPDESIPIIAHKQFLPLNIEKTRTGIVDEAQRDGMIVGRVSPVFFGLYAGHFSSLALSNIFMNFAYPSSSTSSPNQSNASSSKDISRGYRVIMTKEKENILFQGWIQQDYVRLSGVFVAVQASLEQMNTLSQDEKLSYITALNGRILPTYENLARDYRRRVQQ